MRCKSSIVSCAPAGPMTQTTFSASLARSYRRGASPEAVSFPAAAIQLSARIALLRRAKARWFHERGFPGSAFPVQSRGDSVRLPARRQPPQGDGAAGLYKSVPEQIVSVMTARLPPPPFSLSSFRTSVRAGRPRPLFYGLFSPARAARTGVRTPPGTALSVPTGNCSRPGQC